jgi:hypothetical protein
MSNIVDAVYEAVSWGTLRTDDLIIRFAYALHRLAPSHPLVGEFLDIDAGVKVLTEEEREFFLEDLFEILNEVAPEGTYFGAHPGDGSLFGFWPSYEYDNQ